MAAAMECIDLITPPPTPPPPADDDSSGVEEVAAEEYKPSPSALARRLGKRKAEDGAGEASASLAPIAEERTADEEGEDMLCEEVEQQTGGDAGGNAMANDPKHVEGEDNDVEFQGRTGELALSDFPHARENCVSKRFLPGKEAERCENCYW